MPDPYKVSRLVSSTLAQSRADQIDWKATAIPNAFSAVIADGKYLLKTFSFTDYDSHGNESGPPSLSLSSNDNEILLDIKWQDDSVNPDELRQIYQLARDKALGISKALDDVLDFLDSSF